MCTNLPLPSEENSLDWSVTHFWGTTFKKMVLQRFFSKDSAGGLYTPSSPHLELDKVSLGSCVAAPERPIILAVLFYGDCTTVSTSDGCTLKTPYHISLMYFILPLGSIIDISVSLCTKNSHYSFLHDHFPASLYP